ncbi:hypothetical protein INT46_008725 [Mucor plumbeus]|uniref:Uncharacterized protein n=1 Tax=Mucor plumbeus TaxID=97098 RepID=A0A8H7QZA2_9FUNG|nr:hypothetical protein INT46_008725 [Mucor plumbeus]
MSNNNNSQALISGREPVVASPIKSETSNWIVNTMLVMQAPLVIGSIRFDTAASVTTSTKSTSSDASLMDTLKKIFWKRDQYLSLLTDMIAGTGLDNQEGQAHVQDMRIKLSEATVKASMFGNSNGDNGGISRAGGSKARHNKEECHKDSKRSNYVSKANRNVKVLSVQKEHPYRGPGCHGRRTRRSRNRSKNNNNSNLVDENTLFRKAMENKDYCK